MAKDTHGAGQRRLSHILTAGGRRGPHAAQGPTGAVLGDRVNSLFLAAVSSVVSRGGVTSGSRGRVWLACLNTSTG